MKIIIDAFIPFIQGVLEKYAEVVYAKPSEFTPALLTDADAIIIRTRVHCNADLLADTSVKFIATATIGYDHIDTEFCRQKGITWTNAAGCNADGVRQYVQTALEYIFQKDAVSLAGKTIGIVGVGHVGKLVSAMAERKGMCVLKNDPPRQRAEGGNEFVSLEKIMHEADIITFHTPLNTVGTDKTFHICNADFLNEIKPDAIIINAARGGIVDEQALLHNIKLHPRRIVLDCWENEPNISHELLSKVMLGTPHIAGYTLQGKANGTTMSVQALSRFYGLDLNDWVATIPHELLKTNAYDIEADFKSLKNNVVHFEDLRSKYELRNVSVNK